MEKPLITAMLRSAELFSKLKSHLFLSFKKRLRDDPSQLSEARIIQFLFENFAKQGFAPPSTFLEIGANHPFYLSTSWYLEHTLGFRGISVDPISRFKHAFKRLRPSTQFLNFIVVDSLAQYSEQDFFEASADVFSTSDSNEYHKLARAGVVFSKKKSNVIKYSDLSGLMNHAIGVLILDIESTKQQLLILQEIVEGKKDLPYVICVETIEYQGGKEWEDRSVLYDKVLYDKYTKAASTFLNTMYVLKI